MAINTNCYSLVIFDLDGTLIDAFEDIALAANFVRSRNNLPDLSVDEVKVHVGHGARYLVEGVLASTEVALIDENLEALVGFYESLNESKARVYDGVVETLERLRAASVRTAVASNKPHSVTIKVVEKLGLTPYFDIIRGEGNGIPRKPAPDLLHRIMKDAGVPPQRTLMVGDSEIDIECAKAADIRVAVVSYGQHSAERLNKSTPDFMLHSMQELLTIIGA